MPEDQMTAALWGLLAGVLAVALEAAYKMRAPAPWVAHLPYVLPAGLLISYAIYRMVLESPSLPAAVVFFSVSTLGCRVALSIWLGHQIGPGTWAAVGLMVLAATVRSWKP